MAILTAIRAGAPHLRAMVALSLATKVRLVPPVARAMAAMLDAEAGTLAALLEWADTGIILAWTVGVVCRYHRTARLELVAPSAGVSGAAGHALGVRINPLLRLDLQARRDNVQPGTA